MAEIVDDAEDIVEYCRRVLSEKGRLSTAIEGFVARTQQIDLCVAIAEAIYAHQQLVVEAGTGTGKTFAYLIPSLLSRKKTIISTATKTLQDQLFQKDLPLLARALGVSVRAENLKGRANYLCQYRIDLHTETTSPIYAESMADMLHIKKKLPQLTQGVRSELPEVTEDSSVWPWVTSTTDNCLGGECSFYNSCFLTKARKKALEADLVVINHHLFFADTQLKQEGFGELLPGAEVVIFDEAHQLSEIATSFYGEHWGTRQLLDVVKDIFKSWPVLDQANHSIKKLSFEFEAVLDELITSLTLQEERFPWVRVATHKDFQGQWGSFWAHVATLIEWLDTHISQDAVAVVNGVKRLKDIYQLITRFDQNDQTSIRWVERFKHSLVFHATPIDVADLFKQSLRTDCTFIFTSATLAMAGGFECFTKPLGLLTAKTLLFPSPFDYQQQALLYLPRGLPDPQHMNYYDELIKKAVPVIEACGGRSFFLFTSHRALKIVAQRLSTILNYPLLIQGEESKSILLMRFRELGNAVLLGTATFWEGVDVKGEALSCVIIDKIPFANPSDPVTEGKMAYLKSRGLSGFDEISLPSAVLALKQGVGRLIRDHQDKGVLMIADPRLTSRDYGRYIFSSLPLLPKTRDEQKVLTFIKELALENETISH